jgi:hypothetical protein
MVLRSSIGSVIRTPTCLSSACRAVDDGRWLPRARRTGWSCRDGRVVMGGFLRQPEPDWQDRGGPVQRLDLLSRGRDAVQRFGCRFPRPRPPNPACERIYTVKSVLDRCSRQLAEIEDRRA